MNTTRMMVVATLIAGSGLTALVTSAQQPGISAHRCRAARSRSRRTRGHPGPRRFRPGSRVRPALASGRRGRLCPRRHAGISARGKPPVTLKTGEALFIPAGTIHAAKNVGTGNAAELATYIVEKAKPLVVLAK